MKSTARASIYSIGHGNRTLDELVAALRAFGVTCLTDVRSFPESRRNPQFGRQSLARSLPEHGIEYVWVPELGGRRKARADSLNMGWQVDGFRAYADYMDTPAFRDALAALEAAAAAEPTAYMCAERLWWQCHRRLISDALAVRGADVVHILDAGKAQPHRVTEFLQVDGDRLAYPGLV